MRRKLELNDLRSRKLANSRLPTQAFPNRDQDFNEIKHTGLLRCSRCLWAM